MSYKRETKGSFGRSSLPVSPRYMPPRKQRSLWLGAIAIAMFAALPLVWDVRLGRGQLLSNGPLSSAHSTFESDCAACHSEPSRVPATACSTCHEKHAGELGRYSWSAHYLYKSEDFRRVVPSPLEHDCVTCHVEHEGRGADITVVADTRCSSCHEYDSFDSDHPDFDFATSGALDASGLKFPHSKHLLEALKEGQLVDVELACLTCHEPESDGRGFAALDFDRHCDACHLSSGVATSRLPIATEGRVGVETVSTIRGSGAPGTSWTWFANPNEYREVGARVMKTPLHHRDAWVLHNLRQLRTRLYGDGGLADLLTATPVAEPGAEGGLYVEAIGRLEELAIGLRSRPEPEIREDLDRIQREIEVLEQRLEDPLAPIDETRFLLALSAPLQEVSDGERREIDELVMQLTKACRQCHIVEKATIGRVRRDQGTLGRADFDHRSHIVQTACLDCHDAIPLRESVDTGSELPPEIDRAEIHNLPTIETCRSCHQSKLASQSCTTCHRFHVDRSSRAAVQPAGGGAAATAPTE